MRIPDQLLHCRYDVNLTLQVADANFVVCELSSKVTVSIRALEEHKIPSRPGSGRVLLESWRAGDGSALGRWGCARVELR